MATDWKEVKHQCGSDALNQDFPDYEVIEHRIGNQTNADGNNNKFFSIELHKCSNGKFRVYTNYGRVSDDEYTGSVGIYGPATESEMTKFFNSKFDSKVRPSKGYIEIKFVKAKVGSPKARQKVYKVSEDEVPEAKKKKLVENKDVNIIQLNLHPTISKLVSQWYNDTGNSITKHANIEITSNGLMTPLGVLSFSNIENGRKILFDLNDAIKNNNVNEIKKLNSAFFSVIPTKLSRKINNTDMILSEETIQLKAELLKQMEDALIIGGDSFSSNVNEKYKKLNTEIDVINNNDTEWQRIYNFIQNTRGSNHYGTSSKINTILKVCLSADKNKYEDCSISNEQELFHGSRNGNATGILSRGLMVAPPEAPVSGWMFSKGIYAANSSTKSLNYSWKDAADNCFLYIVKMKLGKQKKLYYADINAHTYCKNGEYDSVMGCKGNSLIHDEFIIYNSNQCKITHVVEIQR